MPPGAVLEGHLHIDTSQPPGVEYTIAAPPWLDVGRINRHVRKGLLGGSLARGESQCQDRLLDKLGRQAVTQASLVMTPFHLAYSPLIRLSINR